MIKSIFKKITTWWTSTIENLIHPGLLQGIKIAIFICFALFLAWALPVTIQPIAVSVTQPHFGSLDADSSLLVKETASLKKQIATLDNKLKGFVPKNAYIIINSTENEFSLYNGTKLIRQGKCSTGSYLQLEISEKQKWLFKTPKGEFKIRNKETDRVWKKPDWAFVEEGLPIPSANHPSRNEYGVLGDYALSLGDGYMIHGTIWQRYLGLPVTHGCVRLNDADLEAVYKALSIGSKVYIF